MLIENIICQKVSGIFISLVKKAKDDDNDESERTLDFKASWGWLKKIQVDD